MNPQNPTSIVNPTDFISPATAALNAGFQVMQNQQNYKNQVKMFEMANAYNAPINQVKRLKEAGLNPALMYNSQPQNVATMPTAPRGDAPKLDPLAFHEAARLSAQTRLSNVQAANAQQQLLLETARTQAQLADLMSQIAKREGVDTQLTSSQTEKNLAETVRLTNLTPLEIQQAQKSMEKIQREIDFSKFVQEKESVLLSQSKQALESTLAKQQAETKKLLVEISQMPSRFVAELQHVQSLTKNLNYDAKYKAYEDFFRSRGVTPHMGLIEYLAKANAQIGESFEKLFK